MDKRDIEQWKEEDASYVKELEYLLGALRDIYRTHKYSLRHDHKEMCEMIASDIKYIEEKKKFVEEMNETLP